MFCLRFYVSESVEEFIDPLDGLCADLFQVMVMVELLIDNWFELLDGCQLDLFILVQ